MTIGSLHLHTLSDAPPESTISYWRVQVVCDGAVETLLLTESEMKKARDRTAKHPADILPALPTEPGQGLDKDPDTETGAPVPRNFSVLDDTPEPPTAWERFWKWAGRK